MTFKNTISFLVLILFLPIYSFAQTGWQWGKRGGSDGGGMGSGDYELVEDIATDIHGNVYVLANNNLNIADIDGHPGISHHDKATISSFDCNGNFRWMKIWGTAAGAIGCKALKTDSLGGVYIAASVSSSNSLGYAYFDADTTLGMTHQKMSLVKYDTAGNFQWLRQPESSSLPVPPMSGTSVIFDMDVAPNGDCYLLAYLIAGSYADETVTIDEDSIYVVKYDRDGNWVSVTPMDIAVSYEDLYGSAELVNLGRSYFKRDHNSGRFYLCGSYDSTLGDMAFGETELTGIGISGGKAVYMGAFNNDGNSIWTTQGLPDKGCFIEAGPFIDDYGNIYMSGNSMPGNVWGGHTFVNEMGLGSVPFVACIKPDGTPLWINNGYANGGAKMHGAFVTGNVVAVPGYFGGALQWEGYSLPNTDGSSGTDLMITKFNATTGRLLSLDRTDQGASSTVTGTANGQIYIGGSFDDELTIGEDVLEKLGGSRDWFVAKHGSSDCNCTLAVPDFSVAAAGFNTLNLSYTGTTPVDSVVWETGDGGLARGLTATHTYAATGSYTICATAYNDCGISVECKTYNSDGTTALGNIAKQHNYSIYPNPASSSLFIKGFAANTTLEIFNTIGKRELITILKDELSEVNVSGLAAGIYLMRFTGKDGQQAAHRFVKQ